MITALLVAGLAGPAAADPVSESARRASHPGHIDLPDGFRPEGIATGRGHTAFVGSLADGDIYAADLRTGAGKVISQGDGSPSVGMKLDRWGRLWVAGGDDGDAKVVDTGTGEVRATYELAEAPTFVNDVVLTRRAAWFTDSQRASLYRVPLRHPARGGDDTFTTVPLGGQWQQVAGQFNANGIATTPGGRALLVVQSVTGLLFRVDARTGEATRVDLGGETLPNGDGLLRHGRTLYVVQNLLDRVAVVRLDRTGESGSLVRTITSPDFDVPTTVARHGSGLYLPNARFTTPAGPDTKYWVTRVPR